MMRDPEVPILLVEDQALLRDALASRLRTEGYRVAIATSFASEDLLDLAERVRPRVVLLDLNLGPGAGGLNLVRPLREQGALVVIVTGSDDQSTRAEALEAGAVDIFVKSRPLKELMEIIRWATQPQVADPPDERRMPLQKPDDLQAGTEREPTRLSSLSKKEQEILRALMDGQHAESIARSRTVSITTVRSQIHSILEKLGVHSQLEAVALARRVGWRAD